MGKKISKYDLTDDMKNYLITLMNETLEYKSTYRYEEYDISNADVVYVRNLLDLSTGIDEGLAMLYKMQRYKIKEQKKLRAGTKNYNAKYYENGVLKKIDCFVNGSFDLQYMASYHGKKRYLIPFQENGNPDYTHTHVLVQDDDIVEEYEVNNAIIIYRRYFKVSESKYDYLCIYYIPKGQHPVNGCEIGSFEVTDKITYKEEQCFYWFMEVDALKKGEELILPDIPYIKVD